MTKCPKCDREVFYRMERRHGNISNAAYCYVVHEYYGCDSGCCGHKGYLCDKDGNVLDENFEFEHPDYGEDPNDYAINFLASTWCRVPVDFDQCEVSTD